MAKYNKFIIALAGAAILILSRHFGENSNLVQDIIGILAALGVYQVPNK